MSFESFVNSIFQPVISTVGSAVENAIEAVSDVTSKIQDEVTAALSGETDKESANADTFTSTASNTASLAAELDSELDETKSKISENKGTLSNLTGEISNIDSQISQSQSALFDLQAAQREAGSEETGQDYSTQIAQCQASIEAYQTQKSQLETQKSDTETAIETLETKEEQIEQDGAQLESDAQGSSSGGQSTASQAEGTAQEAMQYSQNTEPVEDASAETTEAESAVSVQQTVEPTAKEPVEQPAAVSRPVAETTPAADVMIKIHNNETIDMKMADVIVKQIFASAYFDVNADEIIDMKTNDAISLIGESIAVKDASNSVYKNKISTNTDTSTVKENQDATVSFMDAFTSTSNEVNATGVEFLSLTDKSNFETISKVQERLNNGEYILTREIEKAESKAESIKVSAIKRTDSDEQEAEVNGGKLLSKLKNAITDEKDAPEDTNDDILTENEYKDIENFFNSADDVISAYRQMVTDAEQYGIYAEMNLAA